MLKKLKDNKAITITVLIIVVGIMLFGIYQSQKDPPLTASAHTAKNYLDKRGYKVLAYKGNYHYVLTKEKLHESHIKHEWEVQKNNPHQFFGKTIEIEFFVVKNHPLNQLLGYKRVQVSVYMVNGKVVGGTSFPYAPNEALVGSSYSLDGKTLEQLEDSKRQ